MNYQKYFYRSDFIKLIIEEDVVGYYLIVYYNPNSIESNEDYLVDSLEEAFKEAEERFGVLSQQWELQKI